mmetsp:Transcript_48877/g.116380  ORF Transcript_48877/g.116380 Transcript_48877/m.116380 type:complete len:217 (-) Transcript_48877:57-707(-)
MMRAAPGTRSEGLRMNALPVPMAMGSIQRTIMAGKLKGAIPATTPSGCRIVCVSMLVEICSMDSPMVIDGIAIACSTTSMPRKTSPMASALVLPFSATITSAIRPWLATRREWSLMSTRQRCCTGVSRHFFAAAIADWTIASISACVAHGTRHSTSCVAGSFTSSSLVEVEGFSSPSIQSGSVSTLILARLAGCDVVVCRERSLGEGSCSGGRIPG